MVGLLAILSWHPPHIPKLLGMACEQAFGLAMPTVIPLEGLPGDECVASSEGEIPWQRSLFTLSSALNWHGACLLVAKWVYLKNRGNPKMVCNWW